MFYGDLPYILGYATSGTRLKIVTIDRHLHVEKIVEFYSIIAQKEGDQDVVLVIFPCRHGHLIQANVRERSDAVHPPRHGTTND